MTETQLRFLHAVAERVGADRVVEVRLFPPIRQSGVESGVAIIAAERLVPDHVAAEEGEAHDADSPAVPGDSQTALASAPPDEAREEEASGRWAESADEVPVGDNGLTTIALGAVLEDAAAPTLDPRPSSTLDSGGRRPPDPRPSTLDSGGRRPPDPRPSTLDPGGRRPPDPRPSALGPGGEAARYEFLSARYRLTLKGMDRGKWEFDIVHEADAPLDTVERVVRGVQRRTGDVVEPEQLAGHAFRHALEAPSWTVTT